MKKIKKLISLIFILLISISCDKTENTTDYAAGYWTSQEFEAGTFEINLMLNETYTLKFTLNDESIGTTCQTTTYYISDGKNEITLAEPIFDENGDIPSWIFTTEYKIERTRVSGIKTMTWTPIDDFGGDYPILIWTNK